MRLVMRAELIDCELNLFKDARSVSNGPTGPFIARDSAHLNCLWPRYPRAKRMMPTSTTKVHLLGSACLALLACPVSASFRLPQQFPGSQPACRTGVLLVIILLYLHVNLSICWSHGCAMEDVRVNSFQCHNKLLCTRHQPFNS